MIVIGLTGKIGSGKSTTSKIIKGLGYNVFDCDECSKVLMNTSDVKDEVISTFKKNENNIITNNHFDIKAFGNHVFSHPEDLLKLEKILHPKIKRKEKQFVRTNCLQKEKIVFIDIPLLFRENNHLRFDYIIYVYINMSVQSQRVLKRPTMNKKKFINIMNKQKYNNLKYNKFISLKINTGNGKNYVRKKLILFINKIKDLNKKKVWPNIYNFYNKM